jgi:hypothetical protein
MGRHFVVLVVVVADVVADVVAKTCSETATAALAILQPSEADIFVTQPD